MPRAEQGICNECGKAVECLNTSVGWMCRSCFLAAVQNDDPKAGRAFTMPEPGEKVFVIKEPPDTYITVAKVLYAFMRKIDADEMADGLRRGYGVKAFVEHVDAMQPLSYVLNNPELRLISVAQKVDKGEGPGFAPMPKL